MSLHPVKYSLFVGVVLLVAITAWLKWPHSPPDWSEEEIRTLVSLSLESLAPLQPDPSNSVADNAIAASLGRALFFDTRLSSNGAVSCATCHQEERRFTDGLKKAQAIGTTDRHTPSIVGSAYSPWQFWDGRRDSLWSQALAPLEDPNEHGTTREKVVELVLGDENYKRAYDALFTGTVGDVDVVFANIGKVLAAFERTVMPTPSRFDAYVEAVQSDDVVQQASLFSEDEVWGLRLFVGEANCTQCHNGPLLTNYEFHNTGVISYPGDLPDVARAAGVREVIVNEFNCRGDYSDDPDRHCPELQFALTGSTLIGSFKTPSLRNLDGTEPFMHKGQLATLSDVLKHYNDAPDAMIGHNEAKPLGLNKRQLRQLEAFLETLAAPVSAYQDGGDEASSTIEATSSL